MNKIISKISLAIIAFIFVISLVFVGFGSSPHNLSGFFNERRTARIVGIAIIVLIFWLPARSQAVSKWKFLFWVLAVLIAYPFAITKTIFGANELESILIFFRDNQAEDIAVIGGDSFARPILVSVFLLAFLILTSLYLVWRVNKFDTFLAWCAVVLLLVSPITLFLKNSFTDNQLQAEFQIEDEMGIEVIGRPDKKKNLIVVYLESVERTYADIDATKEAYQPILKMAEDSLEATNVNQTVGTTITIAGIIASQCGVPLLPQGLSNIFFKKETEGSLQEFLPSITCLGDILAEDGYDVSYINGASLNRFSKRGFFTTHGYNRVFGLDEAPAERVEGRTNAFGMNDALMFEFIYEEYDRLISKPDPFALNFLTVSTHGPDAFLDTDCPFDETAESQLPLAMECTFKLLEDFIDYTKTKGNGRETEVVIMSDHLAMSNTLKQYLRDGTRERRNLFIIENGGKEMIIERQSTAMDIYPTLLEQMGYQIADSKGNLGRSMFSKKENLIERYGPDDLRLLLKGNHELSNYIWRPLDADVQAQSN